MLGFSTILVGSLLALTVKNGASHDFTIKALKEVAALKATSATEKLRVILRSDFMCITSSDDYGFVIVKFLLANKLCPEADFSGVKLFYSYDKLNAEISERDQKQKLKIKEDFLLLLPNAELPVPDGKIKLRIQETDHVNSSGVKIVPERFDGTIVETMVKPKNVLLVMVERKSLVAQNILSGKIVSLDGPFELDVLANPFWTEYVKFQAHNPLSIEFLLLKPQPEPQPEPVG